MHIIFWLFFFRVATGNSDTQSQRHGSWVCRHTFFSLFFFTLEALFWFVFRHVLFSFFFAVLLHYPRTLRRPVASTHSCFSSIVFSFLKLSLPTKFLLFFSLFPRFFLYPLSQKKKKKPTRNVPLFCFSFTVSPFCSFFFCCCCSVNTRVVPFFRFFPNFHFFFYFPMLRGFGTAFCSIEVFLVTHSVIFFGLLLAFFFFWHTNANTNTDTNTRIFM